MDQEVESGGYKLSGTEFERFRKLVRERAGIALRPEKRQLVCSRLSSRLRKLGLPSFAEYFALLSREGEGELVHLLNAITTNKTSFFREAHHFEMLVSRGLLPKLHESAGPLRYRIWSAGCSSGEEVYSGLASVLDATPGWERADIRALASDLDTNVLALGERGVYSEEALEQLPGQLGERWFIRGSGDKQGLVRVRRPLRERVAFRRINFIEPTWPVRTQFDAIFCRNALIYFEHETQREIVSRLLRFLKPDGLLFLGHSESMAGARPDLKSLGRTAYQYQGAEQ